MQWVLGAATLFTCLFTGTFFLPRFSQAGLTEHFGALVENPALLLSGAPYAIPLLLVLLVHEFGHFAAARKNRVLATWPYLLPAPPYISLGTFGAFIKIREPIPDRNALMQIGAGGPLPGFVASLLTIACGFALLNAGYRAPADFFGANVNLPLGFWIIRGLFTGNWGGTLLYFENPVIAASWIALFFQGLNMLPVGQLDGGHVVYSLFRGHHRWVSRGILAGMTLFALREPQWLVWIVLLLVLGLRHPPCVRDDIPLSRANRLRGVFALLVLLFSFHPVPFEV